MKLIEQHQIFGGLQQVWAHDAQNASMRNEICRLFAK